MLYSSIWKRRTGPKIPCRKYRICSREGGKYDYVVTCDKGWSKKCEAYSCLGVVKSCLNQGGCATVCKANMVYVPDIKAFYISADIDELVSSEVEGEF